MIRCQNLKVNCFLFLSQLKGILKLFLSSNVSRVSLWLVFSSVHLRLMCFYITHLSPYNKVIIVGDINIHIDTDNGCLGITSMSLLDSVSFGQCDRFYMRHLNRCYITKKWIELNFISSSIQQPRSVVAWWRKPSEFFYCLRSSLLHMQREHVSVWRLTHWSDVFSPHWSGLVCL